MRINRKDFETVYTCICNAIRETDLRATARRVSGDAEACYAALGKRPNCGACLDEADAIIFEEREMAFEPACSR